MGLFKPKKPSIQGINAAVNSEYRWGSPATWDKADGVFDCENFAREKYRRLMNAGLLIRENMRLVQVKYPGKKDPVFHVVLVFVSAKGFQVLDNRYASIVTPKFLEKSGAYVPTQGWWPAHSITYELEGEGGGLG